MTPNELRAAAADLKHYWSDGYPHDVVLGPMALKMKAQVNAVCDAVLAEHPADAEHDHERENGPAYAAELDAAADILQRVHPIGQVKAVGRLEVAAVLRELYPADDADPADSGWLESVGGEWHDGECVVLKVNCLELIFAGDVATCEKDSSMTLRWECRPAGGPKHSLDYCLADNPTRGDVRRLFRALGEELKEKA